LFSIFLLFHPCKIIAQSWSENRTIRSKANNWSEVNTTFHHLIHTNFFQNCKEKIWVHVLWKLSTTENITNWRICNVS
jgi:hypothetical protein